MVKYFRGWYFKAQSDSRTVALIPALHTDGNAGKSASIQVITDTGSWCAEFPQTQASCDARRPRVTIGENVFCERGVDLNIRSDTLDAAGHLSFGPPSPPRYDIMGPFRCVPFMECRHSVFSLTHTVNGSLELNGKTYEFNNGAGYIEGDRGRSFPKAYAWTQCHFPDGSPGCIMLSAAEIPFCGARFTGIIGAILWRGHEYRLATYLGARAARIGGGEVAVAQGRHFFSAKLIRSQDNQLYAPVCGGMGRLVRESLTCTARYLFMEGENILFAFETDRASFEYEYGV